VLALEASVADSRLLKRNSEWELARHHDQIVLHFAKVLGVVWVLKVVTVAEEASDERCSQEEVPLAAIACQRVSVLASKASFD